MAQRPRVRRGDQNVEHHRDPVPGSCCHPRCLPVAVAAGRGAQRHGRFLERSDGRAGQLAESHQGDRRAAEALTSLVRMLRCAHRSKQWPPHGVATEF